MRLASKKCFHMPWGQDGLTWGDAWHGGVDILPLIHKCFPYQPFKNQVILPQFSPKLPLIPNQLPQYYPFNNVFGVFTSKKHNIDLILWYTHGRIYEV